MTDLALEPLTRLSALVAARRASPVDIVEACLGRIAALDGRLHAFIAVHADDARMAAAAAERAIRSGHGVGPLHGLPIALKDLVEIEGRVATGGSSVWRERRSRHTATLVKRLIRAGMIVIGKTHTVEFAFGGWGTNAHLGTPINPWDGEVPHAPGGSSSGSAVAVAARMVPCAIGTDTGGSVRLPAAWCGITGLKTTIGRISTHGVLPLSPTLDTPGPLTRSVEDAGLLLGVLQGADPLDWRTQLLRDVDPGAGMRRGVTGLRLARLPASERTLIDAAVADACDRAVDTFAALGAEIVELNLPRPLREYGNTSGRIMAAEAYALLADIVDNPELALDPAVRPRIRAGAQISAREYLQTLAERERLKEEFAAATAHVDALLTPVTTTPAVPLQAIDQASTPAMLTRWVNFLDLCALAVPAGCTAAGLPIGLQIVCRGGEEAMALRIGWAWQNATEWHARLPPLSP
jgi:aspartyl-tRNA(Asn)/glutamyl-tRNA(Gln) amidotransferase subunit A